MLPLFKTLMKRINFIFSSVEHEEKLYDVWAWFDRENRDGSFYISSIPKLVIHTFIKQPLNLYYSCYVLFCLFSEQYISV